MFEKHVKQMHLRIEQKTNFLKCFLTSYFYERMFCLHVSLYTICVLDPLGLESCHVGAGNWTRSPKKATTALNLWANSSALQEADELSFQELKDILSRTNV